MQRYFWILLVVIIFNVETNKVLAEDTEGLLKEKITLCESCHGAKGGSQDPQFPILAGQHFYYLYVQLKDYKEGSRKNEIMSNIVADLSKEDMKALAQHFSEQSWPLIQVESQPELAKQGEAASESGQCVQCHLGGYEGESRIPRLAGQHPEYLEKTMLDFKEKIRTNSAAKSSLLNAFK
ncbi:MAG TPA: cytochrome C, partial [Dehalococcoidia bacterium]|nr:cytochrome C [Dehalococcoidia bacterium]